MANKFVHLHLHTEYSLLDGLSKIGKLMVHLKENGMDTAAITDHGAMYGVIEFYKKALKEGIKPVIGMEGYVTNVNHRERLERGKFQNYHLLLLAKNLQGYKNLMKLTSVAHLEGYYYRPRVDRETLKKYSEGLICTSACAQGEIAQALIQDNFDEAKRICEWHLDVFGKDYYLEVQRHQYDEFVSSAEHPTIKKELGNMAVNEKKTNEGVVKLSRELGIPIVATNDAHYIKREDATAQDALVCISTAKNVSDVNRLRFIDSPTYYLRSPDEMAEVFPDLPEALENTVKIANKCDVTLTLDKWFFPKYILTEGKSSEEELTIKAREGLVERLGDKVTEVEKTRLEYELDIIKQKGYATYFLIVSDVSRWAHEQGIITNTRGSAAGSLVSYSLGIIDINPLIYELPFERFLTPWRPSPPDIDFDIQDDRREEIVNYIGEKYGHDKVAQICTFGRMMAKASVRDIARVLGYQYATGDRIAKLIPIGSQGFPMSIQKALEISPELKKLYETEEDSKKILDLAKQIEGDARHVSVHAAGVVIAPTEITDYTPVQLDPEGKKIITQYDMDSLDPNISPGEAVGLLKFDLLGLRNLSILGAAVTIVKEIIDVDIDLHAIPLGDKKAFAMLARGETMGVFQLSGPGMTRYLKELKPTRVEDLMAMVALYRPGPMAMIPEYIGRKNNPERVTFFDPRMKEFLGKSYGLLVYQDDVFMTAIKIAGYTWEEADKFRKAVGKKIPQEMEKQRNKFIEGCIKNGMERQKAEELFKLIEPFSGYGFNKSHAASYGMVAYQTAYMKANYPVEFMTALLTAESGDTPKISSAVNECRRMGIKVLPPDINDSVVGFKIASDKDSLEGRGIRFGLSAIKNVGKAAIEAILDARKAGNFQNFPDFLGRVDSRKVNKKVVESLIKVGALSQFGTRASLLASLDDVRERVGKFKGPASQDALFTDEEIIKTKGSAEINVNLNISEFDEDELHALERQLLGLSLTGKSVIDILSPIAHLATHKVYEISPHQTYGESVRIAGVVSEVRIVVTKKTAAEMAFVRMEDDTGSIEIIIFPKIFSSTRDFWVDYKPLVITGRIDTREEEPIIIAEKIETIESALNSEREVYIKVPKDTTTNNLRELKALFLSNEGTHTVILIFEGKEDKSKKIRLPYKIAWSEVLARQISLLLEGGEVSGVQ